MIKDILYGTTQTFYSIVKHNTWVKKNTHTQCLFDCHTEQIDGK
jgi:hypothetical protein